MTKRLVKAVRITAYVEATLFLLLLVAVVVQVTGHGSLPATIVGSMHGTVFTLYIVLVVVSWFKVKWSLTTTLAMLLIACIPGGGYVVDRYAFKYGTRSTSRRNKAAGQAAPSAGEPAPAGGPGPDPG